MAREPSRALGYAVMARVREGDAHRVEAICLDDGDREPCAVRCDRDYADRAERRQRLFHCRGLRS